MRTWLISPLGGPTLGVAMIALALGYYWLVARLAERARQRDLEAARRREATVQRLEAWRKHD